MGGNERGKGAIPTSISIFDSYGMKSFWFEFGYYIFAGVKIQDFKVEMPVFSYFMEFSIEDL